ncbi:MAG TPA: NADPH-dependent FMN reductase [Solirubrobacterales bacterium]|jgi:chromate reductase|nr:NADPH-dependent FMN reductase [Solirubrobacterales bacterium]
MRVLGISGSLRGGSHNTALLRTAAELLPPPAGLEVFEGLKEVPPYDADDDVDPAPERASRFRQAVAEAHAVLIATPEYNSSVPGQLKNAIDWASRPFPDNVLRGKPAAVIGASTGMFGAVWAQAELRKVLGSTGARVIDLELPVSAAPTAFDGEGRLADPQLRARLEEILAELVDAAEQRYAAAA